MRLVTLPARLEERTFDQVVRGLEGDPAERRLFDASPVRWVDPYGMLGLLAVGAVSCRTADRPVLRLPESPDVVSYLTRMGFFTHAADRFEIHDAPRRPRAEGASEVLLEIMAIQSHADVHAVVDLVNERGVQMLTHQLGYPGHEAFQFSVVLSEVCQNIVEHAEAGGWVATQSYNWARRLGRQVVAIAVMDIGIGFAASLAPAHAARHAGRWTDAVALEAGFLHGQTRFHDPGRGQGLQQIRKRVGKWEGRISIRSGTARIADVPAWDDAPPMEEGLPFLRGAQIGIVLPARVAEAAPAVTSSGRRRK
ncbi:MAG: ATP-binding protein [Gemmatimonadetes bacterium]|nr:ATP-binding protein [Gemmatimonadota bacterium]